MKKIPNQLADKPNQQKSSKKAAQQIKFNLQSSNLACFKGKEVLVKPKTKIEQGKDIKNISAQSIYQKEIKLIQNKVIIPRERERALSCTYNFSEKVLFMQYHNLDVYIDNSHTPKSIEGKSKESQSRKKSEQSEDLDNQIVQSCVRVITEETDNTSNNLQTPPNLTPNLSPRANYYQTSHLFQFDSMNYSQHNEKSMSQQQGRQRNDFVINFESIENDWRTTVMVRNIPNKYSQETLLEEFSVNFQKKFDFFYLPIDKKNNCNIGYAFLNFTNPAYIKEFYLQFHNKTWKKYKSPKICNVSYALYQGTQELANHFRHTKILQHRDRKLKPLIGISQTIRIKNLQEMVRMQRQREQI